MSGYTPTFDRAAIKARAEAATEGPWNLDGPDYLFYGPEDHEYVNAHIVTAGEDRIGVAAAPLPVPLMGERAFRDTAKRFAADAEFIAHARQDIPALLAALEEAEREVERLKAAQPPCDGGCNYNSGPEETCSAHGRPVAEVWDIVEYVARQRDEAERRIAAVEKALDADYPRNDPTDWTEYAKAKAGSLDAIRAALHPVAETTESEKNDE